MRFNVLTLFPEIFSSLDFGITGQARKKNLYEINILNIRDFAENKHKNVDGKPYGGGEGMLISVEPLTKCIRSIEKDKLGKVIYMSPQGRKINQKEVNKLKDLDHLTIVCGRYEGIDQRFIDNYVDEELSIGDFVLSGGEYPALCLIDSIIRNIPMALGNQDSALKDTFSNGLLKGPQYTRPENFENQHIPQVLISGNHKEIYDWRDKESLRKTMKVRPDLINNVKLTKKQKKLLEEINSEDIL